MYGLLALDWVPTAISTTPPAGHGPAIVRNDPFDHVIRVTDGWADLGSETFIAQMRPKKLVDSAVPAAPIVDFTVEVDQDVLDLLIIISLTSTETTALPKKGFWDLQQVDGSTLLQGPVVVVGDVTRG